MTTTSSRALWRFTCALLTLLTLLALSLAGTSAQTPTSTRSVSEQSGHAVTWGAPRTLASTESGTANLIFDPNVTVKDRELITESVQLAEGFFAARFAVDMGAEVTVSVLPIPSPLDPYLTAATYGNSIVIYTRSLGWLESPPAERLRVVIHEYTHVYQYLRTADHPFDVGGLVRGRGGGVSQHGCGFRAGPDGSQRERRLLRERCHVRRDARAAGARGLSALCRRKRARSTILCILAWPN